MLVSLASSRIGLRNENGKWGTIAEILEEETRSRILYLKLSNLLNSVYSMEYEFEWNSRWVWWEISEYFFGGPNPGRPLVNIFRIFIIVDKIWVSNS